MPDEQYYALANLVKRPMRRWWTKVGSWWMLGLGVLLVTEVTISSFAFPVLLDSSFRSQIMINWRLLFLLNERLVWITPAISVGVALMCAINVLAIVDKVTHETIAYRESVLRGYKYRLALLSCWPALLPALFWSALGCYSISTHNGEAITFWQFITYSLRWFLQFPTWVVWLVAIATVTTKTRWPAWAYFICGLVASRAIGAFKTWQFSDWFSQPLEFSNLELTIFMVVSVVLVYGFFSLYLAQQNRFSNLLCLTHCMFLLLAGIKTKFDFFPIDYIIQASSHLPRGFRLVDLLYSTKDEPVLQMYFGAFMVEYPAGQFWAMVTVVPFIFWLFAHYFAFSWLMGRDWRKRGG